MDPTKQVMIRADKLSALHEELKKRRRTGHPEDSEMVWDDDLGWLHQTVKEEVDRMRQKIACAEAFGMKFGVIKDGESPDGRMSFDMDSTGTTEYERLFEAFTENIHLDIQYKKWKSLAERLMSGKESRAKIRPDFDALSARQSIEQYRERKKELRQKDANRPTD